MCCLRDVDWLIIDPCSAATRSAEELITSGIVHNPKYTLFLVFKADGYTICRKAMCKVCGAVERIDNPQVGRVTLANASPLFREEGVIGIASENHIDDALLGGMICLRNEIDSTLVLDAETVSCITREDLACLSCRMNGCFQEQGNRCFIRG